MNTLNFKFIFVFLLAAAALFFGVARAAALDASTEVFRLSKTHVEIKITLPGGFDPGAKYGGVVGGKHFQCEAVSADVLICIGPYRVGSDPALLSVYDKSTKEIIFQETISAPRLFQEGEEEQPLPGEVCDPETDPFGCDVPS